jgi:uncharacterized protein (TIGR02599 family)
MNLTSPSGRHGAKSGFTLVEMLTAISVLLLILGIIGAATNGARTTMQRSTTEIGEFAAARSAFEDMSQKLSQATLNTYWDYFDATGKSRGYYAAAGTTSSFVPATYGRMSDLHFFVRQNTQHYCFGQEVFFQTPVAFSSKSYYQDTQGLMCACSFFVEYCKDTLRPNPLATGANKWRYRLCQGLETSDKFAVYNNVSAVLAAGTQPAATQGQSSSTTGSWAGAPPTGLGATVTGWTTNIINESDGGAGPNSGALTLWTAPVADNVIALVVWPRLPLREDPNGSTLNGLCETAASVGSTTTDYSYDSQGDLNVLPTSTKPQQLSDEQLPPIVQLTAVVIDDASATRIATDTKHEPAAIANAFTLGATDAGNATGVPLFSNSTQTQYNKDLAALAARLALYKINYKIFNTYVVMRESKWSQ